MSADSDKNLEQVRRLLALKRHEQPPPGYFHHFSRDVIVRIKAGELGESMDAASWWSWNGSWMQRAWAAIETRPAVAGAFGVAVCGFFAVGALLSDSPTPGMAGQEMVQDPMVASIPHGNAGGGLMPASSWPATAAAQTVSLHGSANNPALQPVSHSLFEEIQRFQRIQGAPQAFNANYVVPGGN